jgi:hypothetical protein
MPKECAVGICKNYFVKCSERHFHRFPADEHYCKIWLHKCCRSDHINTKNARICSDHFDHSCYERDLKAKLLGLCNAKKVLKKDAVPTLNLKHNSEESTFTSARAKRKTKRARKHVIRDIVTEHENKVRIIQIENRHTDDNTEATIQTVLTTSTELDVTFEENKQLKGNIKQLREQLAVCHKKLSYFHKIQQATKPRHNCRQCRVLSIL